MPPVSAEASKPPAPGGVAAAESGRCWPGALLTLLTAQSPGGCGPVTNSANRRRERAWNAWIASDPWDEEASMPLFLDVQTIDGGVSIDDVPKAHGADLEIQSAYDVRHLRYWVDERGGKVFCLIEAPSAAAAAAVHRQAHGLVADEIHQVKEGL